MRTFVAISLPESIMTCLAALQDQLREGLGEDARMLRYAAPGSIHLTLKFLGKIDESALPVLNAALAGACTGISQFSLSLSSIGYFPNKHHPRVVWMGLAGDNDALAELQNRVHTAVSHLCPLSDDRSVMPHLSLARIKNPDIGIVRRLHRVIPRLTIPQPIAWRVEEIQLIESQLSTNGASYTVLARFPLA